MNHRLVYLCDWLPPDFGAVGQYAVLSAQDLAKDGCAVTLVGLTSERGARSKEQTIGQGTLSTVRVYRPKYPKEKFATRVLWTIISNFLLIKAAFAAMCRADAIVFTGSPPLLLHFIAPLNLLLRKRLIYRITDFYPECLIAERGRAGIALRMLLRLTLFWRRRIESFEVLGLDQAQRLRDSGIPEERICLKRYSSPVTVNQEVLPLPLPQELAAAAGVILYSGNWGVAHDETTFLEAYTRYRLQSKNGLALWLNATGAKADRVEDILRARGLPFYRSHLVPLDELSRLLRTADVHLITLRDAFVGYVLPSKAHACIESGKRLLFVGSERSDVHLLASESVPKEMYWRISVGEVGQLVSALHAIEASVLAERFPERQLEAIGVGV
jgi:hypothetical protein